MLLRCAFAQVASAEANDSGVRLELQPSKGGSAETMEADVVLVSTGKYSNRSWHVLSSGQLCCQPALLTVLSSFAFDRSNVD